MKRIGYIYENIYDINNIKKAIFKASEKKKDHKYVKIVLDDVDYYAEKVHNMLINEEFVPSEPKIKIIQDASSGKVRKIYKPNFYPDQIVHWSLMLQIEPIIRRGMYQYSVGSIPGRGPSYGKKVVRKWLDTDTQHTKYCLKLDIKKFYPSINNSLMKEMFRRKIKDKKCLALIEAIIDSNEGQPIGYYTSQWFANFFLEGLDHYIKQELKVKYYIRYVDDLVMFGNNKKKLHRARKSIQEYCNSIALNIKDDWQVFLVDKRPIDFLGFRFYINRTTLRRRNSLRIRRRAARVRKKGYLNEKDSSAIMSYWGWLKNTDSYKYYHKYIKPNVKLNDARKVLSINGKIRENNKRGFNYQRPFVLRIQRT